MPLWGSNGSSANSSAKFATRYLGIGSGSAAQVANQTSLFQNSSPEVWPNVRDGTTSANIHAAIGQFALSPKQLANTGGEASKAAAASVGWMLRRAWEGPVVSFTVANAAATATIANGETVLVSNGGINATGIMTTNATGNLVSIAISGAGGGRFVNSAALLTQFNHERHLLTITPTVAGSSGWANGDLVLAGNGTITGIGVVVTGAGTTNLASVTISGVANNGFGLGLWPNTTTNNQVTFTFVSANVNAVNASPFGTANLVTSSNLQVITTIFTPNLGGRAGRVSYECLVEMSSISAANTPLLPS